MDYITLAIPFSKYSIKYVKSREWEYRIMRGDEDLTDLMKNNLVDDLVFSMIIPTDKEI